MSACRDTGRLSQIATMWTEVVRVCGGAADDPRAVAAALIGRYQEAVYGYLTAALRDPDRAAELFQEFALRFLRGDFKHFDPRRGRFRDYLRTVLINLVRGSYARAGRLQPVAGVPDQLPDPAAEAPEPDDSFVVNWRQALLSAAWRALEDEQARGGPPYYSALRARADRPDCPSSAIAAQLTAQLRPAEPFTDAGVRKLLQRGRELFTEQVVAEVARSVPTRDPDRVAQELIDLGFYWFCKKALARWPG
jgi:DNA-directed RNA polymerase specialized sigma24 family protein